MTQTPLLSHTKNFDKQGYKENVNFQEWTFNKVMKKIVCIEKKSAMNIFDIE